MSRSPSALADKVNILFLELYGYQARFEKVQREIENLSIKAEGLGAEDRNRNQELREAEKSLREAAFLAGGVDAQLSDVTGALEDALSLLANEQR